MDPESFLFIRFRKTKTLDPRSGSGMTEGIVGLRPRLIRPTRPTLVFSLSPHPTPGSSPGQAFSRQGRGFYQSVLPAHGFARDPGGTTPFIELHDQPQQ